MNAFSLLALLGLSSLVACGGEFKKKSDGNVDANNNGDDTSNPSDDTGAGGDDSGDDSGTTGPSSSTSDLDNDGIIDTADKVVPYGDFVYLDQGLVASLTNTFLVGYGLGGSEGEYDWCSENLPIERYDDQSDWPSGVRSEKVRFFFPDAVDIFFGNTRTFSPGECDLSTDGGLDEWGELTALSGHDSAVCPNPLDGNRLGLYLMKDEEGVFAPGCQGFGLDPDENPDSDNDGTSDVDEDTSSDTDTGTHSGSDSGSGSLTVEVTKDSSWCSDSGETWELWIFNQSDWVGNWPGLSSPDYIATGGSNTLSGSINAQSGDLLWVFGQCSDGSYIATGGSEHYSSIVIGGDTATLNYSTTDDTPPAGECNKRSTADEPVCQVE
jgi:hypothetical protein